MEFNSNTEEIKYYFRKLLDDDKEHKADELNKYVINNSPNSDKFTTGMFTGALRSLVNNENNYEIVRRGIYKKKKQNISNNFFVNIIEEAIMKTKEKCRINTIGLSEEEILKISNTGKKIVESLENIKKSILN